MEIIFSQQIDQSDFEPEKSDILEIWERMKGRTQMMKDTSLVDPFNRFTAHFSLISIFIRKQQNTLTESISIFDNCSEPKMDRNLSARRNIKAGTKK